MLGTIRGGQLNLPVIFISNQTFFLKELFAEYSPYIEQGYKSTIP